MQFLRIKLKAGILPMVITISILITLIVSSIILLAYYKSIITTHNDIQERLILNSNSGINYILAEGEGIKSQLILDLYGEEKDSVVLLKKGWGVFDIALSIAFQGKHKKRKAAMYGSYPDKFGKSALYLADENRPLSISGNTLIKGDCFLPKAGIKTAYINQQSYQRSQLVDGKIFESTLGLPSPDSDYIKRIENIARATNGITVSYDRNLTNSFFEETLSIKEGKDLILENTFLYGNIIFSSAKTLVIDASADLKDVIVKGEKVIVKEGFKGSLQIFASDTIIVERNVTLSYPSALITYGKSNKSRIIIQERSKIDGVVFIPDTDADYYGNLLSIAKECEITGQICVDGLVELQGTVIGSLMCKRFLLNTPSTLYENHLLDATVDVTRLSKYFLTTPMLSLSKKQSVIKWIY